ncbi:polysaccharide biosynthesis protein vipA/tviB [Verticillium dahliae]|nr:polysaccharide biosynthesis protein vipA/tviB [Verticillium dahliae]
MASIIYTAPSQHLALLDISDATLKGPSKYDCLETVLPLTPPPEEEDVHKIVTPDIVTPITQDSNPLIAVIGVGYVGTHLVSNFSRHWDVLGFDVSEKRIEQIQQEDEFRTNERVKFSAQRPDLSEATHFLISVPTLLLPNKTVDASYLKDAIQTVFKHARPGATIVIESSVAIVMTRELLGPLAKARGCFAGMSPERVDPGRTEPPAYLIPKVISGLDDICPGSLAAITRIYAPVFNTLVPVSRPEVAELTKLYENCQRMINIAYVNEMADACVGLDIDPYEVCNAAGTKPFGYMDYRPGLGVGGHCIPVNPWYLLSGCEMPLLRNAAERMNKRPRAIAKTYTENIGKFAGKNSGKPRVLVVGMGFKPGQSVLSYSPGLELARGLVEDSDELDVMFADPLVSQSALPQIQKLDDRSWNVETLNEFDLVIVVMRQHGVDFDILSQAKDVRVKWWCS